MAIIKGLKWDRQMLFENEVQQSLSRLLNKTQRNLNGDTSLQGLDIDWHLANAEMGFDNFVAPVQNDQPTYAYA
jgi:hypothetical protein